MTRFLGHKSISPISSSNRGSQTESSEGEVPPVTVGEVVRVLETLAPSALAAEWDSVGLQLGDAGAPAKLVLVALELTGKVCAAAREKGAGILVLHHPVFFRPWKELRWDHAAGQRVAELVRFDCGVVVAHTNWDAAPGGLNHHLAGLLGLEQSEPLTTIGAKLYKLVTFVPADHLEKVRQTLAKAGAGWIGNYSHCTFAVAGTGTFLPREGTSPFIGQPGVLERVDEVRLETVLPESLREKVLTALLTAHPYEEVAYEFYPLANMGPGMGRVGELASPCSLGELANRVAQRLEVAGVRLTGDPGAMVERVAVVGGAGGDLLGAAVRAGAQVLVTGEVRYHQAREAEDLGLAIIEAGHYASEAFSMSILAEGLRRGLAERGERAVPVEVCLESEPADPQMWWAAGRVVAAAKQPSVPDPVVERQTPPPQPAGPPSLASLVLRVDGASKGNPGEAGYGVVVQTPEGETVGEIAESIGVATNNVAEYRAFIRGLEEAKALGATQVRIFSDSELAVRQVNGIYKVKDQGLAKLHRQVKELLKEFRDWKVDHVPREQNTRADALAGMGVKKGRIGPGR